VHSYVDANVPEKNNVSTFRADVRIKGFTTVRMMMVFWILVQYRIVGGN
jgi:hypothetical protein